jgi:hypothetical protein
MAEDDPTTAAPRPARARRRTAGTAAADGEPAEGKLADVTPADPPRAPVGPVVVEDGASMVADAVEVHRSLVGRVESGQVSVSQGAIGAARADAISVDGGAIGAAMGGRVELSRSYASSILARQVQLDRGAARVVIAADVRASQTAVMFLIARRVSGEVRVLFDWRGALAFGAVAGVVVAVLSRARRRRAG